MKIKQKVEKVSNLPAIPDKRYFTIGETSTLCGVGAHVLRYWEQEFDDLKPVKRRGNRRYYQEKDIHIIRHLAYLLYKRGFTIEGARHELVAEKKRQTVSSTTNPLSTKKTSVASLKDIEASLEAVLKILE